METRQEVFIPEPFSGGELLLTAEEPRCAPREGALHRDARFEGMIPHASRVSAQSGFPLRCQPVINTDTAPAIPSAISGRSGERGDGVEGSPTLM